MGKTYHRRRKLPKCIAVSRSTRRTTLCKATSKMSFHLYMHVRWSIICLPICFQKVFTGNKGNFIRLYNLKRPYRSFFWNKDSCYMRAQIFRTKMIYIFFSPIRFLPTVTTYFIMPKLFSKLIPVGLANTPESDH